MAGYTIPPGHQVCVSPTVNQRLKDSWVERLDFNPDRYLQDNPASGEKFAYVPFGAGKIPFYIWNVCSDNIFMSVKIIHMNFIYKHLFLIGTFLSTFVGVSSLPNWKKYFLCSKGNSSVNPCIMPCYLLTNLVSSGLIFIVHPVLPYNSI